METYFASPEKSTENELQEKIAVINKNQFVANLVKSLSGMLAIIDEHRQVVAVNDDLVKTFGWDSSYEVFGLKPGEIIHCEHADEQPNGCGTTKHCATCGAAIAIVTSLGTGTTVEKMCSASVVNNGVQNDICFKIRSIPVTIESMNYALLFIQDMTVLNTLTSMERMFFHDINNTIGGLLGTLDLMVFDKPEDTKLVDLFKMTKQIADEIQIQKTLLENKTELYQRVDCQVKIPDLFNELRLMFSVHPVARDKHFEVDKVDNITVISDYTLLYRIVVNMLKNAFEASSNGDTIRLWADDLDDATTIKVWNKCYIPEDIQLRIFQRHFSTKDDIGRGVGTYSMKFLGEKMLKCKVGFESSNTNGTIFWISIPKRGKTPGS
jgi:K+-sensing histidine kinase KdpD